MSGWNFEFDCKVFVPSMCYMSHLTELEARIVERSGAVVERTGAVVERTGAVGSASDSRPRGLWFDPRLGRRLLWP